MPVTLASADGVSWFISPEQPALAHPQTVLWSLAALGGDWVAGGFSGASGGIPVWWSANGLDWEEVARIEDPEGREWFGYASHLVEADGRVLLSAAFQGEGTESRPADVWTSVDGRSWSRLDLPGNTEIRAATPGGPGMLLAGREGDPAGDGVIWATNEVWLAGQ